MQPREIKFRAWDTSDKIWLDMGLNFLRLDGEGLRDANGWVWNVPGRVVLEQFTGLHDKNGKEIYEGDITKRGNHLGLIVFHNGGFCILSEKFFGGKAYIKGIISRVKFGLVIIGNIHENPELLKGETHGA
jgi:uncharacterized phage protein (TIGR01671 family)